MGRDYLYSLFLLCFEEQSDIIKSECIEKKDSKIYLKIIEKSIIIE